MVSLHTHLENSQFWINPISVFPHLHPACFNTVGVITQKWELSLVFMWNAAEKSNSYPHSFSFFFSPGQLVQLSFFKLRMLPLILSNFSDEMEAIKKDLPQPFNIKIYKNAGLTPSFLPSLPLQCKRNSFFHPAQPLQLHSSVHGLSLFISHSLFPWL